MTYILRPADETQLDYAHDLTCSNMTGFYVTTQRHWDPAVFRDSWPHTENFLIEQDGERIGVLRVAQAADRLYIRDLQVEPARQRQGAGMFALQAARELAVERGLRLITIRVFRTNAAKALYMRAGFRIAASNDDMILLDWPVAGGLHPQFA